MSPFIFPELGRLPWIDVAVLIWFVLIALSLAYVALDIRRNPEPRVMKWGWLLVTLYMGPIGLALYVLADKEPHPGTHETFVRPLWKQAVGSTVHCAAGDATGIIVAATITGLLSLPMNLDLLIEYLAGFGFGLFIFQALFMKNMMGGSYTRALRMSFMPEWLSMNTMMAGMFPTMIVLMMGRDMRAMDPTELVFWGTMSAAVIIGFLTAYPMNLWLVAKGLKHGLMTVRDQEPKQHTSGYQSTSRQPAEHDGKPVAEPSQKPARPKPQDEHAGHQMSGQTTGQSASQQDEHAGHQMPGQTASQPSPQQDKHAGHHMPGHKPDQPAAQPEEHAGHDMPGHKGD